jgi:hypothetical protein
MKILHVVHCIDTEGPLKENLKDTFKRLFDIYNIKLNPTKNNLEKIQNKKINLGKNKKKITAMLHPKLLNYNDSWKKLKLMLNKFNEKKFRYYTTDNFQSGWKFSWHCVDHFLKYNPRKKTIGYGKIFNFYKKILNRNDEINWHFHPESINKKPLAAATSYNNSMQNLLFCISRRIIDNKWFPTVNRPGFHSIRPDSNAFLEQWIPYDYANQRSDEKTDQKDLSFHRFGDWDRAPKTWRGYHPDFQDYQKSGHCRRVIFRCLNLGTRFKNIKKKHIIEAFRETRKDGKAIIAFASHDFRDFTEDLILIRDIIKETQKKFPDVKIKFSTASAAAKDLYAKNNKKLKLKLSIKDNRVIVRLTSGEIFGPQPFLAIKTKNNKFHHDNFDIIKPKKIWSYFLDKQTIEKKYVSQVGIGSAGIYGDYCVVVKKL